MVDTKVLSQNVSGGTATIVQQITLTLTEQDIVQNSAMLQQQQLGIKGQIQQLTDQYNSIGTQIASNTALLAQFTAPTTPTT